MIFVTVGSHEPFDRLLEALDTLAATRPGQEFFGQITSRAAYRPGNFRWVEALSPTKFEDTCASADVLIAHAGMGSIITALQFRKPIVIMPRREAFGETRNDHQYATPLKFQNKLGVFCAIEPDDLGPALDAALAHRSGGEADQFSDYADPTLIAFLKSEIG